MYGTFHWKSKITINLRWQKQNDAQYFTYLTLHEAASGMHPEWQGGQILPAPIKTSLEAILT